MTYVTKLQTYNAFSRVLEFCMNSFRSSIALVQPVCVCVCARARMCACLCWYDVCLCWCSACTFVRVCVYAR